MVQHSLVFVHLYSEFCWLVDRPFAHVRTARVVKRVEVTLVFAFNI